MTQKMVAGAAWGGDWNRMGGRDQARRALGCTAGLGSVCYSR